MSSQELLLALSEMMDQKLQPIRADIAELKVDVAELKEELKAVKADIVELKADVAGLKEELKAVKADIVGLKRDAAELKKVLELVKIDIRDARLCVEMNIEPQIRLLAENYVPSAKKYEKEAAQIGQLWVEIDILKKVVSEHSQKLQMFG